MDSLFTFFFKKEDKFCIICVVNFKLGFLWVYKIHQVFPL